MAAAASSSGSTATKKKIKIKLPSALGWKEGTEPSNLYKSTIEDWEKKIAVNSNLRSLDERIQTLVTSVPPFDESTPKYANDVVDTSKFVKDFQDEYDELDKYTANDLKEANRIKEKIKQLNEAIDEAKKQNLAKAQSSANLKAKIENDYVSFAIRAEEMKEAAKNKLDRSNRKSIEQVIESMNKYLINPFFEKRMFIDNDVWDDLPEDVQVTIPYDQKDANYDELVKKYVDAIVTALGGDQTVLRTSKKLYAAYTTNSDVALAARAYVALHILKQKQNGDLSQEYVKALDEYFPRP